ncbi:MAG: ATP-binding protein [Oscillospiraceae bacterium]
MNYSREAFEKAEQEIERRRHFAEDENRRRCEEISRIAPEIDLLNNKIKSTSMEFMKLIVRNPPNSAELIEKMKKENLNTQMTIKRMLLEIKGDENYLDVPYYCKKCMDRGYVEGKRCSCFNELLSKYTVEELNKNCLVQLHDFSEFRLDYYDGIIENGVSAKEKMSVVYEFCKNYAKEFNEKSPSLFFFGKTGLGKTFLSSCIANELLNKGVSVVFASSVDILRKIEDEHFNRCEGNTMDTVINAELVILDDLGSEFQTSFTESAVYNIINSRINLNKPTIVSTNLQRNELTQKYNERIISRLTGCFYPISFIGKDIRYIKLSQGK